jgi:hypothetical protein
MGACLKLRFSQERPFASDPEPFRDKRLRKFSLRSCACSKVTTEGERDPARLRSEALSTVMTSAL